MKRDDWFNSLIQKFREAYRDLSREETKHISNLDDLTEPCQILSISFDNPPLTKTFILHLPNVEDGKVWQYGPIMPYEAFELFENIIENPIWDVPVDNNEMVYFNATDEKSVKTLLDASLYNILLEIRAEIFKSPTTTSNEPVSKSYFLGKSGVWTTYGDITKTDPVVIATQIIQDAKNDYKSKQEQLKIKPFMEVKPPKPQKHSETVYEWYGTYLFPPVSIGMAPRIPFSQRLFGGIHNFQLGTIVYEDKFDERNFIAIHNGFVGIQETKKEKALEMLNFLAAALFLRGTQSYIIRDHELGNFSYKSDLKKFGSWSMPVNLKSSILNEQRQYISAFGKAKLSIEDLQKSLKDAEQYLKNEQLNFYIPLLLESNTHFAELEYTQSFYMSWVITETYLTRMWEATLREKGIHNKRIQKLKNHSMWSIDYIIEVMDLQNVLVLDYDILMKLKRKRNNILHGTTKASREDAKEALSLAFEIIKIKDW